jgi:hypothetical protein
MQLVIMLLCGPGPHSPARWRWNLGQTMCSSCLFLQTNCWPASLHIGAGCRCGAACKLDVIDFSSEGQRFGKLLEAGT